jgi:hypothetical protein
VTAHPQAAAQLQGAASAAAGLAVQSLSLALADTCDTIYMAFTLAKPKCHSVTHSWGC